MSEETPAPEVPDTLPDFDALPEAVAEGTVTIPEKLLKGQEMRAAQQRPTIAMNLPLLVAYELFQALNELPLRSITPRVGYFYAQLNQMLANWREFGFHPEAPGADQDPFL